jgi:hypothetical protein
LFTARIFLLEAARAAHGAVIARLAARFDATGLLFLEVVHQFGDDCLFHAKLFQTGMRE